MGDSKIKSINKEILSLRTIFIFLLALCLIFPGLSYSVFSFNNHTSEDKKIIDALAREIEIPPGKDYYIKFSSDNLSFIGQNIDFYTSGLSDKIKDAIAKSPKWIQRELTRQFKVIDGDEYADLILNMSKKYTDEIAFSIARSSIGNVPSADILRDNVLTLYENDEWIRYADIIDYDDGQGNYYSTIKYWVIENGTVKQFEYPPEIYYWYVVHPEICSEDALYFYDKFWRDYLFNHNDLGYPLLREKLSEIEYLWDCESYTQHGQRLWSWSIENHPTAIEAISYWIGKTVPVQAIGDRPSQPNVIAHQHNGWCGELQKLAAAAQRTALIASVGINNIGEDHVWREFYERGWHQNDNYWSDGGGSVDLPDTYGYGWKKDMSALFAWKGDDSIYEVTSTYIHPEDRKTVCFEVLDRHFQPVDGVRITVVVKGPNDITWLKYKIFGILDGIWDSIPDLLKGKILQFFYDKIYERINRIPDVVDGLIYTIWNYTDMDGKSCFELGQNRSYVLIIQHGNLRNPIIPARYNRIRIMKYPFDKNYKIWLRALSPLKDKHWNKNMPIGEIDFEVTFNTKSYQAHNSILWIDDKGIYDRDGEIDFFIVDEENFNKYRDGFRFNCYNYISDNMGDIVVNAQKNDLYLVFRNNGHSSNIILNFSCSAEMSTTEDKLQIVSPDSSIFQFPVFNIGETVVISGIATNDILLNIDGTPHVVTVHNYEWNYEWKTSGLEPGVYLIKAECGSIQDEILIKLIDEFPPIVKIDTPFNSEIVEAEALSISGNAFDNLGLEKVEVSLDNGEWKEANGTESWDIEWEISGYDLGDHKILARAFDTVGGVSIDEISIAINESGNSWGPIINNVFYKPEHPTNVSNIVIYANVTKGSPFKIQKVILNWDDGIQLNSKEMFRYADNPVQERHIEDPLKNMPNEPIFGLELGQFSMGSKIFYWIEAFDTANNRVISNKKSFSINSIKFK